MEGIQNPLYCFYIFCMFGSIANFLIKSDDIKQWTLALTPLGSEFKFSVIYLIYDSKEII